MILGYREAISLRDFLKQVDLFSELPDTDLDALSRCVGEIELAAGEELFHEGEAGDRAFVIKEGEIEVLKASTGGQVLLATLGPSEVIGEMAVLEEVPRNASAVARTDVMLVEIKKDDLSSLCWKAARRPPAPYSEPCSDVGRIRKCCFASEKNWHSWAR